MGDGKILISGSFGKRDYRIIASPLSETEWEVTYWSQNKDWRTLDVHSHDPDVLIDMARQSIIESIVPPPLPHWSRA